MPKFGKVSRQRSGTESAEAVAMEHLGLLFATDVAAVDCLCV